MAPPQGLGAGHWRASGSVAGFELEAGGKGIEEKGDGSRIDSFPKGLF